MNSYKWSHGELTCSHCIRYLALGLTSAAVSLAISSSLYLKTEGDMYSYMGTEIIAHYSRDLLIKLDMVEQGAL